MVYDPQPPYVVRQTNVLDQETLQRFTRMAKFWDLVANSGRFKKTLALVLQSSTQQTSPFWSFWSLSDFLWSRFGKSYGLSLEDLVDTLFDYLSAERGEDADIVRDFLLEDYVNSGARGRPTCLAHAKLPLGGHKSVMPSVKQSTAPGHGLRSRQDRHGNTVTG